ncbi:MAG: nucleotidyltransferase domain-containing protein [Anaerolineaceae bacterium]|nr:nucleotidyltransferase domain-containing protein [Anaerolineaceae bacterium]
MDFKNIAEASEYDFLRDHPRLGKRIMLLGVSGSYGYGTNREGSDIDFRGVTLNLPSDLIGMTKFEQYEDPHTDTVIYAFNKFIDLILNCNPNTIEILGLDPDQYVTISPIGQELLDHRSLFLTKRAAVSFGHYATAQLRRLQNSLARDKMPQPQQESHMLNSVKYALENFNRQHVQWDKGKICLYVDRAETEGLESEIFLDADLRHYPLRRYNDCMNTMLNVVRDYDKTGPRNHKKDENHLNKHAMHLVRLYMMGIDILEKKEIRTHRPPGDLALLRSIRDGGYMADGIMTDDFYEIVSEYQKRFEEAERRSTLPDTPDMKAVSAFVESVNRHVVLEG